MVHLWFFSPCSKQLECFSGTGAWSWLTRLTIAWALYFGRCGLTNWSSWSIFSSLLHVIQVWSQPFPVGRCQCSHRMKLAQSRWSGPGGRKKLRASDQLEEPRFLKNDPWFLKFYHAESNWSSKYAMWGWLTIQDNPILPIKKKPRGSKDSFLAHNILGRRTGLFSNVSKSYSKTY